MVFLSLSDFSADFFGVSTVLIFVIMLTAKKLIIITVVCWMKILVGRGSCERGKVVKQVSEGNKKMQNNLYCYDVDELTQKLILAENNSPLYSNFKF